MLEVWKNGEEALGSGGKSSGKWLTQAEIMGDHSQVASQRELIFYTELDSIFSTLLRVMVC